VRRIREAGINASFQNSSIRVADLARPGLRPVFPKMWLNVLLAPLFAMFFSVGAAVLGDVLDTTVRDPDQVSRLMNAEVIGSLPAVKNWRRHLSPIQGVHALNGVHVNGNGNGNGATALARASEGDQALSNYEEAIRTLRNSILLTDFDRRLRSVLLTSASPSEGKSTVAAHLAATHASQHKRTLLIDGDLRRPSVHRLYQVPNSVGLSNVLLEQISWRDAVIRIDDPKGLDVLPAGPSTRRASDLIGMGLAELVEEAVREYDLVVLDAPPLRGFAEPLQMATAVDGVIVVARAGDTSRKALSSVITTLTRLRANLVGVVLNEVHKEVSAGYYYYYGHYSKYYAKRAGV
jgi:succinoglycan biosynthesis transport protein ExoP